MPLPNKNLSRSKGSFNPRPTRGNVLTRSLKKLPRFGCKARELFFCRLRAGADGRRKNKKLDRPKTVNTLRRDSARAEKGRAFTVI